jgi:hypothetical protein
MSTCTCGNSELHAIARRTTADGVTVALWSDGDITDRLGFRIRGVGKTRGAGPAALDRALRVGWLVMNNVCVYDFSEVAALVKAGRRAVEQHMMAPLVFLRRTMTGERFRLVNGCVVIASRDPSKTPQHRNRGSGFMDWTIRNGLRIAIYHDRRVRAGSR